MYAVTTRQGERLFGLPALTAWWATAARTIRARPALTAYVIAICLLGTGTVASALVHLSKEDLVALAILLPFAIAAECLVLRSSGAMTHSLSMLVFLLAIPLVPTPVVAL